MSTSTYLQLFQPLMGLFLAIATEKQVVTYLGQNRPVIRRSTSFSLQLYYPSYVLDLQRNMSLFWPPQENVKRSQRLTRLVDHAVHYWPFLNSETPLGRADRLTGMVDAAHEIGGRETPYRGSKLP
jgi:hypothetical protein